MAISESGNELIFGTGLPKSDTNTLGIRSLNRWDRERWVPTERESRRFFGHQGKITASALLQRDSVLLSGSEDGTIRFWSVETGQATDLIEIGSPISSLAVSPDERCLLVATAENLLRVFDLKSRKETQQLSGHVLPILDVKWSPEGSHFVTASATGPFEFGAEKT